MTKSGKVGGLSLYIVFMFCAAVFTSCASTVNKSIPEKMSSSARPNGITELQPANEIQKKVDEDLRPLLTESFGEIRIVSAVSSDNIDSGIGGWINYSVKSGINQGQVQSFKKQLKKQGFIIAQDMMSAESGRLLFNMIVIKELPNIDYNLNIGTLRDEENIISIFVTVEKTEGNTGSEK